VTGPGPIEPGRAAVAPQPGAAPKPEARDEEAWRVAQSFEALFLAQMLDQMTRGIDVDPTFGGGSSERLTRSMLTDEYAKTIARAGGVGIADAIYREILKLQEVEQ